MLLPLVHPRPPPPPGPTLLPAHLEQPHVDEEPGEEGIGVEGG